MHAYCTKVYIIQAKFVHIHPMYATKNLTFTVTLAEKVLILCSLVKG